MHDIAKLAQVSLGTVSHVINGTVPVREAVRERVQMAIEQLNYQPNNLSRALRTNRSNLIGMIIPDITNPFFPSVVRGVEDVAFKANYRPGADFLRIVDKRFYNPITNTTLF